MLHVYICIFPTDDAVRNKYYLGYFKNWIGGRPSIIIINSHSQLVNYSLEAPNIGLHQTGSIQAHHELIIRLSSSIEVKSHHDQDKGIYLELNSDKVTVFAQNERSTTSDTFLVTPVTNHCIEEYTYYGLSVIRSSSSYRDYYSSVLIVGTQNNTIMNITVPQSVIVKVGNVISSLIAGTQYSFVINRLQTIYIRSHEDLSGTKVVTDKPISMFSGHECARIPWNTGDCDHMIEQILPTALWGQVYYAVPFATTKSYTIKVLAACSFTVISIWCKTSNQTTLINEGEFTTIMLQEYCAIHSYKKVLVSQFSHAGGISDPMMIALPAKIHYADKFDVSTIRNPSRSSYNHYVNIIALAKYYQPNMIYMIANGVNKSLIAEKWIPITVNNIIEAYGTQVKIKEGLVKIVHSNTSALMTTTVYGFASIEGYGHSGTLSISPKNITG